MAPNLSTTPLNWPVPGHKPVNASALIHNDKGQYLLHLRDNRPDIWEPGAWSLLGGGYEPDDRSLVETVRRELREEAGLHLPVLEPFAVEEAHATDGTTLPIAVYVARWNGDPADLTLTEGVMLHWFSPEVLSRLRISPTTLAIVQRHAGNSTAEPLTPCRSPLARRASTQAPSGTVPHIVGVHLYLQDARGRILLGLRHPDSTFAPATWHFLAGHCEQESALACLTREAQEEAGLHIDTDAAELVHVVHLVDTPGGQPRIGMIFRAHRWSGTPKILEPDKCTSWDWWHPDDLPARIVPYTRAAIEGIRNGRLYTELGWEG